ncbi:MAG TPA: hypothetical protein VF928_09355 [Usitatibacteraceae bacterium]
MSDALFTVRMTHRRDPGVFFDMNDLLASSPDRALQLAVQYATDIVHPEHYLPSIKGAKTIIDLPTEESHVPQS